MIQLKDIQFHYPQSDFSLSIEELSFSEGSKIAIIGPSGSGKTTMLNLIAGILVPDKGRVHVDSTLVNELNDNLRRSFRIQNIGFVFQDFRLVPYLSVMDNILLPYRINTAIKPAKDTKDHAQQLAMELGIEKLLKKFPAKLSHGERQRVAIARALITNPKIILADEPTGNLDPKNKIHIRDILFDTVRKYGATLITVTHDVAMLDGFDNVFDFQELKRQVAS
jgi:putative ABC transport system ATP-binding protein